MQQLTNLVVNRTADNIAKSFTGVDIEKARHGVYADTEENRRLHRVGQEYGNAGKKEEPAGDKGKKPEEQAGKGGKKPEQQPANKKPAQKEELFSKNGMLDEGGKLNQKSEHVKRMYELEKKVDSGKATPEEKQEYVTLRNQAKNESDRYVHEGRKKLGVKEDEPKYKTVEERRADYKAQKQTKEEKPADKMRKDKKAADLANSIDGLAFTVFNDPDGEYGKLLDEGYDVDSKKVKDVVFRETVNVSKPFFEDIRYAVNKYGKDAVKELMSETDLFDSFEGLDDYVISQAIVAGKEQKANTFKGDSYVAEQFVKHFIDFEEGKDESMLFNEDYIKMRKNGASDKEIREEVTKWMKQKLAQKGVEPESVNDYVEEAFQNLDGMAIYNELKKK